ncbi:hypothetical protein RIN58_08315 [Siccibacter colletis]|nr:hypothetical protein [Siccibacter colletis]WNN50082.1 hypothetical protein RIN58_08315 [Siccibacter colletis]
MGEIALGAVGAGLIIMGLYQFFKEESHVTGIILGILGIICLVTIKFF